MDRHVPAGERECREAELPSLPRIHPFIDQLYDLEKIAIGAYSLLEGFMDSAALSSVLAGGRLPSGRPWTVSILLPSGAPIDRAAVAGAGRSGPFAAAFSCQPRPF